MNNELRNKMQAEAVQSVIDDRYVIVNWATGAGKSRVAIHSVRRLFDMGKKRVLLLVTETAHKDNWRREFCDCMGPWAGNQLFKELTVECYASLKKYEDTDWDCIIADEAHHLRSVNRCGLLSTMRAERFLCLSATISENCDGEGLLDVLYSTYGDFKVFTFSLQEAIESKILSVPRIYLHVLSMGDVVQTQEVVIERGFKAVRRAYLLPYEEALKMLDDEKRFPNITLTVRCTLAQGYELLSAYVEKLKSEVRSIEDDIFERRYATMDERYRLERELQFRKTQWKLYGAKRKTLLGVAKTEYAKKLIEGMDEKFICFCANVEQAEKLGGENVIHSKRKRNQDVIDSFNRDDIHSLFAVGMIQEGANLKGIEAGVVVQLGGKEREFIQKFGRAMRSGNPEQHIIVINKTRDIDYLMNAIDSIDKNYLVRVDTRKVMNFQAS